MLILMKHSVPKQLCKQLELLTFRPSPLIFLCLDFVSPLLSNSLQVDAERPTKFDNSRAVAGTP